MKWSCMNFMRLHYFNFTFQLAGIQGATELAAFSFLLLRLTKFNVNPFVVQCTYGDFDADVNLCSGTG